MRRFRQWAVALLLLAIAMAEVAPLSAAKPSAGDDALSWPARGRLTQRFGCTGAWTNSRVGSCRHFHNGLDIANRAGTPIRAVAAGTVAFAGWNPHDRGDKAWIVIVSHGNGLRTWYAHMQPRVVAGARRGQQVAAGDVIGYMGATGHATGVHLHFGVQRNGRFVNPRTFLDGAPAGGQDGEPKPRPKPRREPRTDPKPEPEPRAAATPEPTPEPVPSAAPTVDGKPQPPATAEPRAVFVAPLIMLPRDVPDDGFRAPRPEAV